MLDHFSRSKLSGPTTGELRLATSFCKALERLCVELDVPIYLNSTCRSPNHKIVVDGCPGSLCQTSKIYRVAALDVARAHALGNFENAALDIEFLPIFGINQLQKEQDLVVQNHPKTVL